MIWTSIWYSYKWRSDYIEIKEWIICIYSIESSVPVPIYIEKAEVIYNFTPNFIEASIGAIIYSDHISMSAITKRSICWVFTITEFKISTFRYIERDWTAPGDIRVTRSITTWISLTESTWTPRVHFALL